MENIATHNGHSVFEILGFDNWHYEIYSDASILRRGAALFQNSQVPQRSSGYQQGRKPDIYIT